MIQLILDIGTIVWSAIHIYMYINKNGLEFKNKANMKNSEKRERFLFLISIVHILLRIAYVIRPTTSEDKMLKDLYYSTNTYSLPFF